MRWIKFAKSSKGRFGPFRIIYYIKPDQIDVLAVIHAAQDAFKE